MHRFGPAILSAIVGLFLLAAPASADDADVCAQASAAQRGMALDEIIAGCTRIIDSGQAAPKELTAAYRNRGRAWGDKHEAERAAADYNEVLKLEPTNADVLTRALLATLSSGAVDDAAALAQRVLAVNKGDRMARIVVAVRAIKQGQYAAARREIAQSGRAAASDPAAALLPAWTQASPGEARFAVNSIDRLNGQDWYVVFKDLQAALILDLAARRNDAIKRFERAYGRDLTALRVVLGYASLLSREGRKDEALTMLAALEQSLPRHPLIVEAIDAIKAGNELAPLVATPQAGAAEALYELGEAFGQRDGEELGLVYLQLALYLEPSHALALLALGDLYENLSRHEFAIRSYERVARDSPLLRKAQIEIAINFGSLDRLEESKSRLEQLIAADPRDLEAFTALGTVLRNGKQFAECAEAYSRGIATIDKERRANWTIYYFRGICFERSNQWPKAEADFKKALALNPEQPHVLNYLGYSWVDQGVNLEEGMSMIRRAGEASERWLYHRLTGLGLFSARLHGGSAQADRAGGSAQAG